MLKSLVGSWPEQRLTPSFFLGARADLGLTRISLYGIALLASLGLGCGSSSVAEVGKQSISLDEFDRQLRVFHSVRPDQALDERTRQQILNQMVKQEALVQEAKRLGLASDPAVKKAMDEQSKAVRFELLEAIASAQAQLDQLDRAVEQRTLIEALLQSQGRSVLISEAELKAAYADRKAAAGSQPIPGMAALKGELEKQLRLEKLFVQVSQNLRITIKPEVLKQSSVPLSGAQP